MPNPLHHRSIFMDRFTTVDDAMAACETAGLEPRIQHGGLGETSYWVYLNGSYSSYWSDRQFLGWANAYFALIEAANAYFALIEAGEPFEDDEEEEEDDDLFFLMPAASRGEA